MGHGMRIASSCQCHARQQQQRNKKAVARGTRRGGNPLVAQAVEVLAAAASPGGRSGGQVVHLGALGAGEAPAAHASLSVAGVAGVAAPLLEPLLLSRLGLLDVWLGVHGLLLLLRLLLVVYWLLLLRRVELLGLLLLLHVLGLLLLLLHGLAIVGLLGLLLGRLVHGLLHLLLRLRLVLQGDLIGRRSLLSRIRVVVDVLHGGCWLDYQELVKLDDEAPRRVEGHRGRMWRDATMIRGAQKVVDDCSEDGRTELT